MKRLLLPLKSATTLSSLFLALSLGSPLQAGAVNNQELSAEIECITPDGRAELLRPNEPSPIAAAILRDQHLSCPLQTGVTTFVIKLRSATFLDQFIFINENAAAAGELKISVSNDQLPAKSAKWLEVDGSVNFNRKRLFNLSMLGVDARYVKLTFNVATGTHITATDRASNPDSQKTGAADRPGVQSFVSESKPALATVQGGIASLPEAQHIRGVLASR